MIFKAKPIENKLIEEAYQDTGQGLLFQYHNG